MRAVRADVHQFGDGTAGSARRVVLEKLAHLIEDEHRAALVKALGSLSARARIYGKRERAQRGYAHEEVFVQHLPVQDAAQRPPQDVIAYSDVDREIQREGEQPAVLPADGAREPAVKRLVRDEQDEESGKTADNADKFMFLFAAHIHLTARSCNRALSCGTFSPLLS